MKTVAITAVLSALVAIPFIVARRKAEVLAMPIRSSQRQFDSNLRYDVDDFLTE